MGPWSDRIVSKFGYDVPFAVKRGYHVHYAAERFRSSLIKPFQARQAITPVFA